MKLKTEEKTFLWKKYVAMGLSEEEADHRLTQFVAYLNSCVERWTKRKLSEDEIDERFKKEFWNLCRKLEV